MSQNLQRYRYLQLPVAATTPSQMAAGGLISQAQTLKPSQCLVWNPKAPMLAFCGRRGTPTERELSSPRDRDSSSGLHVVTVMALH